MLPLHTAIGTNVPKGVTVSILNAYPKASSLADHKGILPLHLAMKNEEIDEDVIKLILKSNLEGVNTKDKDGKSPFRKARLLVLKAMQEKIRLVERIELEINFIEERDEKQSKINKLKVEIYNLKDLSLHQELEVRLVTDQDTRCREIEEEREKKDEKL